MAWQRTSQPNTVREDIKQLLITLETISKNNRVAFKEISSLNSKVRVLRNLYVLSELTVQTVLAKGEEESKISMPI